MAILSTYPKISDPFKEGSHLGLDFYYGIGVANVATAGVITKQANFISLTDNSENYIQINVSGNIINSTTGFNESDIPLYQATTVNGVIDEVIDSRSFLKGGSSNSISWKGVFSELTTYLVNDCISYGEGTYICIVSSIGNFPDDTVYWSPLGSAGGIEIRQTFETYHINPITGNSSNDGLRSETAITSIADVIAKLSSDPNVYYGSGSGVNILVEADLNEDDIDFSINNILTEHFELVIRATTGNISFPDGSCNGNTFHGIPKITFTTYGGKTMYMRNTQFYNCDKIYTYSSGRDISFDALIIGDSKIVDIQNAIIKGCKIMDVDYCTLGSCTIQPDTSNDCVCSSGRSTKLISLSNTYMYLSNSIVTANVASDGPAFLLQSNSSCYFNNDNTYDVITLVLTDGSSNYTFNTSNQITTALTYLRTSLPVANKILETDVDGMPTWTDKNEQRTIATSTSEGTLGEVCYDVDYIYVCVATDTWKRSALTTW